MESTYNEPETVGAPEGRQEAGVLWFEIRITILKIDVDGGERAVLEALAQDAVAMQAVGYS